jgi:hypothetical protein
MSTEPRTLTSWEAARFLARHPVTASRVAATEYAMLLGMYDPGNYYDRLAMWPDLLIKFPGIIEPQGIQVEDSEFRLVTVFPGADKRIHYSGFSPALGDIDKPAYVPPPHDEGFFDDLIAFAKTAGVIGIVIYLGGKALQGRKS